jgi:hypothetical protein
MQRTSIQNARGEWVPVVPVPLYVGFRLRRTQCKCGRRFKTMEHYEGHYALVHILGLEAH